MRIIKEYFLSIIQPGRAAIGAISREKIQGWAALGVLVLVAAGLRFTNLASLGYANHYYSAATLSMTQSWHNFFFLAAEPGAAVSLDKPPLGSWFQAVSASIFGINSFGLLFPQLLAGTLSVLMVYYLVRRSFGTGAGLLAGLIMAVLPDLVAIDRNNTMDSILIFTLLLAAWAFIKATESNQNRFLWLGGFLVGAGFNIKMLEAFLPLPAFFLLYFTGAKDSVWRKLVKLGAATVLILAVSLSWVTIVDMTDSSQRPYVDNSGNNSVFSLVKGYNGIQRVMGLGYIWGGSRSGFAFPGTGTPGLMRLWVPPLNKEVSWFLPMGLVGILVLLFSSRLKRPLLPDHQTLILWGGWLVVAGLFLSLAVFIHEYYLAILAPPLAVLPAVGLIKLWQLREKHFWTAVLFITGSVGGCLVYQVFTAQSYIRIIPWLPYIFILFSLGVVLMIGGGISLTWLKNIPFSKGGSSEIPDQHFPSQISRQAQWITTSGIVCLASVLLLTPGIWAGLTNVYPSTDQARPMAYDGKSTGPGILNEILVDRPLLTYLQENTKNIKYLWAVPSSMQGADYVLATGRPVLYIGGFTGADQAIASDQLEEMVSAGELRYVYWGTGFGGSLKGPKGVSDWINSSCRIIPGFGTETYTISVPDGTLIGKVKDVPSTMGELRMINLYDCRR